MSSTDELILKLEEAIQNLLIKQSQLKKENLTLKDKINELEESLDTSRKDIRLLENKNKEMKIVSALSGNTEHKRLMKHKLNSLIKEVDLCIAEVKQRSF